MNVTHILARKQTPTQYSWFSVCHYTNHNALISTGNSMLREQHANATVGQAFCCRVSHEYTIDLSSSEKSVEINRCFKTNIYCNNLNCPKSFVFLQHVVKICIRLVRTKDFVPVLMLVIIFFMFNILSISFVTTYILLSTCLRKR